MNWWRGLTSWRRLFTTVLNAGLVGGEVFLGVRQADRAIAAICFAAAAFIAMLVLFGLLSEISDRLLQLLQQPLDLPPARLHIDIEAVRARADAMVARHRAERERPN